MISPRQNNHYPKESSKKTTRLKKAKEESAFWKRATESNMGKNRRKM